MSYEGLRPGFAEELLARLESDGARRPLVSPVLRKLLAGAALTASVIALAAGRRRSR